MTEDRISDARLAKGLQDVIDYGDEKCEPEATIILALRELQARRAAETDMVLPKINDIIAAEFCNTDLMGLDDSANYQWTQTAVDFACLLSTRPTT